MSQIFESKIFCNICKTEIPSYERLAHVAEHIRKKQIWSEPCKLNGHPDNGVCLFKEHYNDCQNKKHPLMNNWMCWRDGILFTHVNLKLVLAGNEPDLKKFK
jgi:hypothetical protein